MALTLTITPAGRAALVNAQADGTNAVRIARVGLTATAFVPGQPLPNEIKRLASVAGGATAKDTVHVTVTDAGTDVYTVRGFGWYLDDGTLFGSYGQANVIVEKSVQSTLLLATDVQFADADATQITFGDTTFNNPAATLDTLGVVKLAGDEDATAGTDTQRAVTPKSLLAALNARLGAAAPTAFVKKLLGLATAAAFRLELGLKGAALKDDGPGNGLDADTLDGQHGDYYRAWANLTDKPTTFTPSAHTHPWSDITNPPAQASRWPAWSEVTAKPDTFTPAPHSHAWSDINNPPMQTQRWPAWSEVTAKPTTFAPSAHTHAIGDVTNLQTALDAKAPTQSPVFQGTVVAAGGAVQIGATGGAYATLKNDGALALNGGTAYALARIGASNTSVGTRLTNGLMPSIDGIAGTGLEGSPPLLVANGGNASASAVMAFLRESVAGGFLGLDTDNVLKWGGWTMGPARRVLHDRIRDAVLDGTTWVEDLRVVGNPVWHSGQISFAAQGNGWMKFPNGFLVQWGMYLSDAPWNEGTGPALSFPIAFPNGCLSVQVSDYLTNVGGAGWSQYDDSAQLTGWDRTHFTTFIQFPGGANANRWCGLTYFALGY